MHACWPFPLAHALALPASQASCTPLAFEEWIQKHALSPYFPQPSLPSWLLATSSIHPDPGRKPPQANVGGSAHHHHLPACDTFCTQISNFLPADGTFSHTHLSPPACTKTYTLHFLPSPAHTHTPPPQEGGENAHAPGAGWCGSWHGMGINTTCTALPCLACNLLPRTPLVICLFPSFPFSSFQQPSCWDSTFPTICSFSPPNPGPGGALNQFSLIQALNLLIPSTTSSFWIPSFRGGFAFLSQINFSFFSFLSPLLSSCLCLFLPLFLSTLTTFWKELGFSK